MPPGRIKFPYAFSGDRLIILGGANYALQAPYLVDVVSLSLTTMVWTPLTALLTGDPLPSLPGASAILGGDASAVFVFSSAQGVTRIDLQTLRVALVNSETAGVLSEDMPATAAPAGLGSANASFAVSVTPTGARLFDLLPQQ